MTQDDPAGASSRGRPTGPAAYLPGSSRAETARLRPRQSAERRGPGTPQQRGV